MTHEVTFAALHGDGTVTNVRRITQAAIGTCAHFMMVPEHYREDGSCRCDDPQHQEMHEFGYRWDEQSLRWV